MIAPEISIAFEHPPVARDPWARREQGLELPIGVAMWVQGPGKLGCSFLSQNEAVKSLPLATLEDQVPSWGHHSAGQRWDAGFVVEF
jgi:hypothetical protein